MRALISLLLASLLLLLAACSAEDQDLQDAASETAVDQAVLEGPITQPVVDAFVPLDGRSDAPVSDSAAADAAAADAGP